MDWAPGACTLVIVKLLQHNRCSYCRCWCSQVGSDENALTAVSEVLAGGVLVILSAFGRSHQLIQLWTHSPPTDDSRSPTQSTVNKATLDTSRQTLTPSLIIALFAAMFLNIGLN